MVLVVFAISNQFGSPLSKNIACFQPAGSLPGAEVDSLQVGNGGVVGPLGQGVGGGHVDGAGGC